MKGQRYSGIDFGLSVVLDPDIEDYSYPIRNTRGFDVRHKSKYIKLLCLTDNQRTALTTEMKRNEVKMLH